MVLRMTLSIPIVIALALGAEGYPRYLTDHGGVWREPTFGTTYKGDLGPGDVKALRAQLDRIAEIVRKAPPLAKLDSWDALLNQGYEGRPQEKGKPTGEPDQAGLQFRLFRYTQFCKTCPPKPEAESSIFIRVSFNSRKLLLPEKDCVRRDAQGKICVLPATLRQVAGFPVYQGLVMFIQRDPSRPLFLPVSQERYIRAAIAAEEKSVASYARLGKTDPKTETRLSDLQAELAGLTPAERAAPAYHNSGKRVRPSGLGSPGSRESRPLVTDNPELFDPALPRTAFQLAAITTHPLDTKVSVLARALLEGVDWGQVQAAMQDGR
jgi:hypothetical protein